MNNKSVNIITLGCRVNQYESCAIAEKLSSNGFSVNKCRDSEYYIVNTCAVTSESERKSRQLVRRCASKGKTIVIGCASQLNSDFEKINNVIYVTGNRNKLSVCDVLMDNAALPKNSVADIKELSYEDMSLDGSEDIFSECRAFIKIQDGCNGKCTYCIIPKCRGTVCSREVDDIVSEAERLVANGYKEIILTGIEVGAYNKAPLSELIKRISDVNGVNRLRLGSLSPNVINKRFLETISACSCFMPHLHLSIQSCSDSVLAAMKRPYRKQDVFDKVKLIREYIPHCNLSADIIVGFPGESESDFIETAEALNELGIFHVHSFPYSEREGTPAAVMTDSIPKKTRSERNARLIASCTDTRKRILDALCDRQITVLVEKISDGYAYGHSNEFFETKFQNIECSVGDVVTINVTSHDGTVVEGYICNQED